MLCASMLCHPEPCHPVPCWHGTAPCQLLHACRTMPAAPRSPAQGGELVVFHGGREFVMEPPLHASGTWFAAFYAGKVVVRALPAHHPPGSAGGCRPLHPACRLTGTSNCSLTSPLAFQLVYMHMHIDRLAPQTASTRCAPCGRATAWPSPTTWPSPPASRRPMCEPVRRTGGPPQCSAGPGLLRPVWQSGEHPLHAQKEVEGLPPHGKVTDGHLHNAPCHAMPCHAMPAPFRVRGSSGGPGAAVGNDPAAPGRLCYLLDHRSAGLCVAGMHAASGASC